jgi:WD40 repeat protein
VKALGENATETTFTGENPFPGLRPFEDGEAYLFFGRETQVDELLRRLRTERFIAVVGTSGSGKSSLIRAGLFSALRVGAMSGAGSRWRIATMRPGNDPIGELASELERAKLLGTDGDAELRVDLAYAILERGALGLVEIVRQMPIGSDENVLIVVDQFEELFRYAQTEEDTAAAFVNLLLEATSQPDLRLYVVLTMRSDFLGDCAAFTDLPERINRGLYLVPRMTREQLEAAIVGPVKVANAQISPQLVNRLLNDVGDDPDQLPVLAHALMLTYDLWAADHASGEPIDERHYNATGGLSRAIDQHAERIYASLTPKQQEVADKLCAAITELGPDNRGIRRPLSLAELCAVCGADEADVHAIVDAYRARTASFLRPPPDVPLTEHTVIDISHEALMRGWSRLGRLLTEEVESARTYGRLSDAAQMYALAKGGLLTDPALTLNVEWRDEFKPSAAWAKRYGGDFPSAMGFLERSAQEKARQRDARRAASRRRWTIAGTVMAVLLLLTFASIASFLNAQRERTESLIAQSEFLARDANAEIEKGDAVTGMLIAQEALPLNLARPDRPYVPAAALALQNGLNNNRELRVLPVEGQPQWSTYSPDRKHLAVEMGDTTVSIYDAATYKKVLVLRGHTGNLYWVAYSPDGKRLVTASADRTARIWDAATGKTLRILRGHQGVVYNAVFSPDGKSILTASIDGTARIWRADTGTVTRIIHVGKGSVSDAEYSPDGSHFVTVGDDKLGRIWNSATGALLTVLRGHRGIIYQAAYSPDGNRIVTTSPDQTAIVWDAKRGTIVQTLRGHSGSVTTAQFSPDNKSVVTGSSDLTARIWDASTGDVLAILGGHTGPVIGVTFTHDGSQILTTSGDGTLRWWAVTPPGHVVVLTGHEKYTTGITYSPDGTRIATGSGDHTARIWNAKTGVPLLVLRGHTKTVGVLDFSPDGKRIVTPSGDGTVRIWNAMTGAPVFTIHTTGTVYVARYSPDGKRIVSAGDDKMAHLWNAQTGAPLATFRGHTDTIDGAAFSPDGTLIATGGRDNTARIWNVSTGKLVKVLRGHSSWVSGLQFSPDGSRILTGSSDGTARIWDVSTGKTIVTMRPNKGTIYGAALSPDGSTVALGMLDEKAVRLYDASGGAPLANWHGHLDGALWVVFSPDGKHVASTSYDRTARIWDVPPRKHCEELIDAARQATPVHLTDTQREEEFLGDRQPAPLLNTFASAGTCR